MAPIVFLCMVESFCTENCWEVEIDLASQQVKNKILGRIIAAVDFILFFFLRGTDIILQAMVPKMGNIASNLPMYFLWLCLKSVICFQISCCFYCGYNVGHIFSLNLTRKNYFISITRACIDVFHCSNLVNKDMQIDGNYLLINVIVVFHQKADMGPEACYFTCTRQTRQNSGNQTALS